MLDLADEIQVRERDDLSFADRDSNLDEPVDSLGGIRAGAPKTPRAVVRRMRRIWIIKKENQPYGYQFIGLHLQEPVARCFGRHADRPGRAQGHAVRRRRSLRPARELHRRSPRCHKRLTCSS